MFVQMYRNLMSSFNVGFLYDTKVHGLSCLGLICVVFGFVHIISESIPTRYD